MVNTGGCHLDIKSIEKSFGDRKVINDLSVEIEAGEFIAIVGKSGCGKSTLLRLIAGLESTDDGKIKTNDEHLKGLNHNARMMFQDGRLLPWKRVIDNVCLGLSDKARGDGKRALSEVGLEERMHDYPSQLSGGQKQRVALARALVHNPALLLLDEPLGALDALTRLEMQELIERLWLSSKFTAILVTHDVEEAVAIADRVLLIEDGSIQLDQKIALPRPRKRTSPFFQKYVEQILTRIMGRDIEIGATDKPDEKPLSLITSLHH